MHKKDSHCKALGVVMRTFKYPIITVLMDWLTAKRIERILISGAIKKIIMYRSSCKDKNTRERSSQNRSINYLISSCPYP